MLTGLSRWRDGGAAKYQMSVGPFSYRRYGASSGVGGAFAVA
jgi:hypothetical protein